MSENTVTYWQPLRQCDIETTVERTSECAPLYPERDGASFETEGEGWTVEVTHEWASPTMSPIDHAVMMGLLSPDGSYADFDAALPEGLAHEDVFPHAPQYVTVRLKYEYSPTDLDRLHDGRLSVHKYGTREVQFNGETKTRTDWIPYYDTDMENFGESFLVGEGQIVVKQLNDEHEWELHPHPDFGEVDVQSFPWAHAMGEMVRTVPPRVQIHEKVRNDKGHADASLYDLLDSAFNPELYRQSHREDEDNTDSPAHADD